MRKTTIRHAIQMYLDSVTLSRSERTANTYRHALDSFQKLLADYRIDIDKTSPTELSENSVAWFADKLKEFAPATEQLYLVAARGFFEYLAAERLAEPNLARIQLLIKQRSRRLGVRLPQFPKSDIDKLIDYANNIVNMTAGSETDHLRNLRDRAFLVTLADTGLRVHEACKLRRGDLDWNEGRAIIIGKGNQQAVVRFSARSMHALRAYLSARAALDGAMGRPLPTLPLFARHDRGAGKKVKPITTRTGQNIVDDRVREALGEAAVGTITPHSFRHYFVTTVLLASGNLKMAQELARHKNISVTQRYAHLSDDELDRGYLEIFDKT